MHLAYILEIQEHGTGSCVALWLCHIIVDGTVAGACVRARLEARELGEATFALL